MSCDCPDRRIPDGSAECHCTGCSRQGRVYGRLWRWADACDAHDRGGRNPHGNPPHGLCTVGEMWRPATFGQRIRHWRRR